MTTETAYRADAAGNADGPGTWAVLLPPERYEAERLVHHDSLELTGLTDVGRPGPGDRVAVLADAPPRLVALGRVTAPTQRHSEDPDDPQSDTEPGTLVVTYTRRAFDEPVPTDLLTLDGLVTALEPAAFRALADRLGPPRRGAPGWSASTCRSRPVRRPRRCVCSGRTCRSWGRASCRRSCHRPATNWPCRRSCWARRPTRTRKRTTRTTCPGVPASRPAPGPGRCPRPAPAAWRRRPGSRWCISGRHRRGR